MGLRFVPLRSLLHFSPLRTYSLEDQAHASCALVVLSLLILVTVLALGLDVCTARSEQSIIHNGFACCVRDNIFSAISVHRLMSDQCHMFFRVSLTQFIRHRRACPQFHSGFAFVLAKNSFIFSTDLYANSLGWSSTMMISHVAFAVHS